LVFSITHTENYVDQLPCVSVSDYSSQTTGPICIKITLVDKTYHGDQGRPHKGGMVRDAPWRKLGEGEFCDDNDASARVYNNLRCKYSIHHNSW